MMKEIFYFIHLLGMIAIILSSGMLVFAKMSDSKLKLSTLMLGGIHMQFLVGLVLFFINLSSVNHAKIGVKILLALFLIILGTMHHRKIKSGDFHTVTLSRSIFFFAITITLIAFLW